ncbi:MmcQ/YjbR family DNA-binding protein [Cognatilysobacter bugurensis]|uniref:MmcQ/YjbR family DNA-binding protein n=1 Tax=Cognatilysobacter bugurensis TaxID=543356 RepID=A0A918SSN4_9GAMM|nr:MmcQ/YjbR family DNA-binding protein [Lysobacter bugurensis]GHA69491.1 hypothetical protein GCM10007067_01790 [Lysobacter bugurensis]
MDEPALRDCALAWPGVSAEIKWQDDLVFSVDAKMFCVLSVRGPQAGRVSFKVDDHRFLELTGQPGFAPAPYLARARWVQVSAPDALPGEQLRMFVRRSYELVRGKLSKRRQRELID